MIADTAHNDGERPVSSAEMREDGWREPPERAAVVVLEGLLRTLFPEATGPDIVTVKLVLESYQPPGLGKPALEAIARSGMVIRNRGDYSQVGLAEFHAGLIHLYWDQCDEAADHFASARQAWMLVNDAPAMCLAHYAQGLADYHKPSSISAMNQFDRARRLLDRPGTRLQSVRFAALAKPLIPLLEQSRQVLNMNLWSDETGSVDASSMEQAVPLSVDEVEPEPQPNPEPEQATVNDEGPDVAPPPISNMMETGEVSNYEVDSSPLMGPISGVYRGIDSGEERYNWWVVVDQNDAALPSIEKGKWLLVDREIDESRAEGREYVVVGSASPDLGQVLVRSTVRPETMPYCYLGYRIVGDPAQDPSLIYLEGKDEPLSGEDILVLALVKMVWDGAEAHPQPNSE